MRELKKYKNMDFILKDKSIKRDDPTSISVEYHLPKNLSFTGRSISRRLVIFQNKWQERNRTIIMIKSKREHFFFIPVNDIYLDYNKTILIMPKFKPVYISQSLYSEITPSRRTGKRQYYVFAPDSDIDTLFKEVLFPQGQKLWMLVYERANLQKEFVYNLANDDEPGTFAYMSRHAINEWRIALREDNDNGIDLDKEAKEMTDELFEEAGYDFMD